MVELFLLSFYIFLLAIFIPQQQLLLWIDDSQIFISRFEERKSRLRVSSFITFVGTWLEPGFDSDCQAHRSSHLRLSWEGMVKSLSVLRLWIKYLGIADFWVVEAHRAFCRVVAGSRRACTPRSALFKFWGVTLLSMDLNLVLSALACERRIVFT